MADLKIYTAGGAVRDSIMGRSARDTDYVVINSNETEFIEMFPSARAVGKKKGIYIVNGNEYTLSDADSIENDLNKRDLTINALAKDESGRIYTHELSMQDIRNRILRPVSSENFFRDASRVFRAARFSAEFPDFKVSDELFRTMEKVGKSGLLAEISAERIGHEVIRAFGASLPSNFLKLLKETDCLEPWLHEIIDAHLIPAGPLPYHNNSLFEHTCEVMDKVKSNSLIVWMAFCHDFGKTMTPSEKWPHHYGHEKTGVHIAEKTAKRLRLPLDYVKAGKTAALWHMKAGMYGTLRPGTRVDMLSALHRANLFTEIFRLAEADRQNSFMKIAEADYNKMLSVKLPEEFQGMGEKSAFKMRELRCQAISSGENR